MKKTLNRYEIAELLMADSGNAGWTRTGALALADYLEEYEESTGQEMELDVVAIRCDFAEYRCLEYWARDYFCDWKIDIGIDPDDSAEEMEGKIREYIRERGELIEFDGGIIVSSF